MEQAVRRRKKVKIIITPTSDDSSRAAFALWNDTLVSCATLPIWLTRLKHRGSCNLLGGEMSRGPKAARDVGAVPWVNAALLDKQLRCVPMTRGPKAA